MQLAQVRNLMHGYAVSPQPVSHACVLVPGSFVTNQVRAGHASSREARVSLKFLSLFFFDLIGSLLNDWWFIVFRVSNNWRSFVIIAAPLPRPPASAGPAVLFVVVVVITITSPELRELLNHWLVGDLNRSSQSGGTKQEFHLL